jgi:flagellar basal-body rod modification protein FlgD
MLTQSISSILDPPPKEQEVTSTDYLGKEDFFELLIAQLKHQDPLEPLKDQEFIAQMAQFSSLEQLQNMNEAMGENVEWNMMMSQTINNTMATSLIGKEIVASSPAIALGAEGPASISFETGSFAASGNIHIYNDAGLVRTIQVENLAAGKNSVEWNGRDSEGNRLPAGSYQYHIELTGLGGEPVRASHFLVGVVESIKYVQGQAFLDVGGALIPLSDVREVNQREQP